MTAPGPTQLAKGQASLKMPPLHLLSEVLIQLPDIKSLGSGILSHSPFYAAFQETPNTTFRHVFERQIPEQALIYALALHRAGAVDTHNTGQIENFLRNWFNHTSFLTGQPAPASDKQPAPASDKSDLTRHEVLVRGRSVARATSDRHTIVHYFTQTLISEAEELHIHDYLERVLSRSFDEVAAHDVEWGHGCVDWIAQGRAAQYKQANAKFLYPLEQAPTYDERLAIFHSKRGADATTPSHNRSMLAFHLIEYGSSPEDNPHLILQPMGERPIGHLEAVLTRFTDGPHDLVTVSGTSRMWLAAKGHQPPFAVVNDAENVGPRRCGYVL
ncbi:hypothetical protein B0H66DRAFT_604147 [Apodospora peruviana]|uniref:Uncharacterized protein n=1 Tax=Apodospora peruviana TaxID=516989 RepID=A0AAE0HZV5_9PEZI|nr:hypothetical protein B0H66DRAFT_604147 [Apodospora peruviana]